MSNENQDPQADTQDKTLVNIKNPATGGMMQVTPEVKELINSMQAITRKDATQKAEAKFKPTIEMVEGLQGNNSDLAEQLAQLKESQMSDSEKLQSQYNRNIKKSEEKIAELTEKLERVTEKQEKSKIKDDILKSFDGYNLVSLEDTLILFQADCKSRLEQKIDSAGNVTDESETRVEIILPDGQGGFAKKDGTPEDVFKEWISQDKRKHLLVNGLAPGSGSSHSGNMDNASEADKLRAAHEDALKAGQFQKANGIKNQLRALNA